MIGLLDRYVLGQWLRTFVLTALGFPLVAILIDAVDRLSKLLDRGLTVKQIAVSYVYALPENVFLVLPAAVLFATVFTVGSLGRHSELTAAKAGGRSFHRLVLPLVLASLAVVGLALVVGEMAPGSTARQLELQKERQTRAINERYNFVYRAENGWVYAISSLDVRTKRLKGLVLERRGTGARYPDLVVTADSGLYEPAARGWRLWDGTSRVIFQPEDQWTFAFRSMRLAALAETPADLLAEPKAPEEMTYSELGRYIAATERSGSDAKKLRVEHALKIAIPFTCLVIALFGAPLAIASARAGTAWGIAVSLGTTLVFLLLAQLAKAVGEGGVMRPELAAWLPNVLFLGVGVVLMGRART